MAFRTKKISQMDPKGSNLASTDLLEISQLVSGSYVTKSITGAQIAASAPAAAWGTITGTLSAQTDLNTALSGKVPTTRTLTINGTTQDLSADRTFTISTGITIGTTAITSGTVGRVLFEGTGNVVQESANLFWDNTNGRLGIGGTPSETLDVKGSATSGFNAISFKSQYTSVGYLGGDNTSIFFSTAPSSGGSYLSLSSANASLNAVQNIRFLTGSTLRAMIAITTGNVLINTTTDAGYKLDVNGTARVNTLTIGLGGGQVSSNTALGFQALNANTTAIANTMVGYQAGLSITTSQEMTGIGYLALRFNASASTAIGSQAMTGSTSAQSVAIGANALVSGTGANNVAIGQRSLIATTSGAGNTAIGRQSGGANTTGGNNIFIGNGADGVSATESNRTWIGNSSTTTSWLGGSLLIGTTTDVASSIATLESTTKGFLCPRMTTTQKNAIASPSAGLMVYDTTLNLISVYNGTIWISL